MKIKRKKMTCLHTVHDKTNRSAKTCQFEQLIFFGYISFASSRLCNSTLNFLASLFSWLPKQALRLPLLALIFSFTSISATELKPWFGRMFELQGRASCLVQTYHSVRTKQGLKRYRSGDLFLDLEAFATLTQDWSVEIEGIFDATRHRTFGIDSLLLTGRYLWLDDVVVDPVSLTTGLTICKVFKPARRDLAVFHHGGIECELHVAVGKELSCEQLWTSRAWAVGFFGMGDLGSPWLRFDANWEHNWHDVHQLRLFAYSRWGLGHYSLKRLHHFHGYGPFQHQSIDTGLRYSHAFDYEIVSSIEYTYRIYSRNCPAKASFFLVSLHYPFGL